MEEILEAQRARMMDERASDIYICTICGREFPHEDLAATFEGRIIDWELKSFTDPEFGFVVCKNCLPGFIRNHGKGKALEAAQRGDL